LAAVSQLPQRGGGGLPVLVVRDHHRPALLVQPGGFGHQHRDLHVGRRPQAKGVAVAVFPPQLVGERLGRHEYDFALLREIRHRSPTFEAKVPISRATCSREIRSSATRTASPGVPPSSRDTTSSWRPSTPPARLISSSASCQPFL